MKRIPLRVESDERFPPGSPEFPFNTLIWADLVRLVIRRPLDPQKGADIDEIRRGIRIFDALDRADATLELEDTDWEHLCEKTRAMHWVLVDRRILLFIEDVLEAAERPLLNGVA